MVGLISVGAWWYLHDPLRRVGGQVVSDQTTLYKPAPPLYHTPRRVRMVFFKDLAMGKLLSSIRGNYPAADGWEWRLGSMPQSFGATRYAAGDRQPEQLFATTTSEGTLELIETRVMSPAEVQMVTRVQGSDAFILDPAAPMHRKRPNNPRLAFGG